MELNEMINKIAKERPSAIDKLFDEFDEYMPAYDSLTVGERFETIQEWRKSLTREEIKELKKWVDLIYFAKVKEDKHGIHET